jgi:dTDP-4-dehydrorhamnose 3,5-epimerase-like enzyme
LIDVPRFADCRGELVVFEEGAAVPFDIKRAFVTYHVPHWETRGQHAHKRCQQLLVALAGAVTVKTTVDGHDDMFELNGPRRALYVPAGVYVEMSNWMQGAMLLVLASERYAPEDYVVSGEGETQCQIGATSAA